MVEIGERDDERHVVLVHERAERGHVLLVVDARHERVRVGVVERRCEPVDVGRDRAGTGALEGGDDVDPLAGAGEEDAAAHGRREYRRAVLRRLLLVAAILLAAAWLVLCLVLFVWPPAADGRPRACRCRGGAVGERARLPKALSLIRRGVAPVLAISSVQKTPKWRQARELCAKGRYERARVVCFLAQPYSTRGEARAIARLAPAHGWRSLVVVSSTFHLTRAKMLFRRCWHGRLYFVGSDTPWWRLPLDWVSETGKLAVQLTAQRGC